MTEAERLIASAALANQVFSPLGWGVANMSTGALDEALAHAETSLATAEGVLADAWTEVHVDQSIRKMKYMYANQEGSTVSDVRRERWEMLREAKWLHFEGKYRASVPLILANIEGFVADASDNKLFFTVAEARKARLEDPTQLAGLACALKTLHELYTTGVGTTTADSVMSRHGIMHGRVLGYANKVTSAKCLTLFDAVVNVVK